MDDRIKETSGMFFVKDDQTGREIGPLKKDQLFILHHIKAGTLVRTAEMTNYERANRLPELELLFSDDEVFECETGKKSTFLNRLKHTKLSVKDIIFLVLTGCVLLLCLGALVSLGIWLINNYALVGQIVGVILGFFIFGAILYQITKVISDNEIVNIVFLSLIGIGVIVSAIMNPSIALISVGYILIPILIIYVIFKVISDNKIAKIVFLSLIGIGVIVAAIMNPSIALYLSIALYFVGCILIPGLILYVISRVLDMNDIVAWAVLLVPVVASLVFMVERLLSGVLSGTMIGIVLGVLAAILACPLLAMYSQCLKDRYWLK